MTGIPLYRTGIAPEWIDYNGHLRDAYYSLIVSLATDALMDRLGIDDHYRRNTHNTLFTLEMHMHFLREVKASDIVNVAARVLATDAKRIHAALDLSCEGRPELSATAEIMLLHVHQGEVTHATPFPPQIASRLAQFAAEAAVETNIPGSRRMELRGRP